MTNTEYIKLYPNGSSTTYLQNGNKIVTAPIGNPPIPHMSKYISVEVTKH